LSIAKQLIEMHGGSITVSSTMGNGSEFTISLPSRSIIDSDMPQMISILFERQKKDNRGEG
jgi:signal transduction histidine kinase